MRLNRYLAACGLGSRRSCEELITGGRVVLNGEVCLNLAARVGDGDVVQADGKKVRATVSTTLLLNKPRGFITTREDEEGRETVYDLLPEHFRNLHYIGRLDKESEGLILLTSSGELTEKLAHPRYGVEKEYLVALDHTFDHEQHTRPMIDGFAIEGGFARAVKLHPVAPKVVSIVLTQGIKRQIRLMFQALGYEVRRLERIRIGGLTMPELKSGRWRVLSDAEIKTLLGPEKPVVAVKKAPARKAAGRPPGSGE